MQAVRKAHSGVRRNREGEPPTGYPEATKPGMEKLLLLKLSNKRPVEFAGES